MINGAHTHTCTPNSWSFWLRRLAKNTCSKVAFNQALAFYFGWQKKKEGEGCIWDSGTHILGLFLFSDSLAVEYTPPVLCFLLATYQKAASSIL